MNLLLTVVIAGSVLGQTLKLPVSDQVLVKQYPATAPSAGGPLQLRSADGANWAKGVRGVQRTDAAGTRVFHSKRYLPCDEVVGLASLANGHVQVRTNCGDSEIWFERMQLEDKAKHYDRIADRHKRLNFVADARLDTPGDLSSLRLTSNDNDGLWTAMYAVAKLYERNVSGSSPKLMRDVDQAIGAVLSLEKISGMPGYPARSYVGKNDPKPKDGFWYPSADGEMQWKSDTSSDEIVGHFLLFSVAWDLDRGGQYRKQIQDTCRRMMDTILANGYNLMDRTGKPTRWGRWSPEYFAGVGRGDSPLNSIELISFLRTTHYVTGDAKYERELAKVVDELGYLKIATEVKERQGEINYSDEELAMLSFYPLIQHERNPRYRELILKALDGWWVNIQREDNPLWNSIYELARGPNTKLREASIRTLQRLPLDLIHWKVENSWRTDLPLSGKADRFGRKETTVLLPADERAVMKWNGNPFVLDGGNGGVSEDDGTIFLLPYWLGRHHKLWGER